MKKLKADKFIFYLGFVLFIICCFLRNTEIDIEKDIIWFVTILILGIKCIITKYTKKEFGIFIIMLAIFAIPAYLSKDYYLMGVPIALIACKDIPLKKVIKIIFIVNIIMTIVTILSSIFLGVGDISQTRIYRSDMEVITRYYFGFVHPNQLSATCFSIIASFIFLKWEKIKVYDYIWVYTFAFITNYYTDSNTSYYATLILIVSTIVLKILEMKKKKIDYKVYIVLIIAIIAFSLFSMLKINQYSFLQKIDYALSTRLTATNKFYKLNGFSLFGKDIFRNLELTLDQGIINVLLRYGIILFSVLLIVLFKFFKKESINVKYQLVVFLFIFYSLFENEIYDIYRNIGIYVVFYSMMNYSQNSVAREENKNELQHNYSNI